MGEAPAYFGEKNLAKDRFQRPERFIPEPNAIVIGSGIGGLSIASILAQRKQWKVLVLEAAPVPGGSTRCIERDGFEWNTGIDSIGDMDPAKGRGLFRSTVDYVTKKRLEWEKMPDAHELAWFGGDDGEGFEFYSSPEKNLEWIEKRFPGMAEKVAKHYKLEDQIDAGATGWGITKVVPGFLPTAFREGLYQAFGGKWVKYMKRKSADVFVNELGFSPQLASIFSYMYGNLGVTPRYSPYAFHACNLYHYKWGAYYPIGGPSQIANCIVSVLDELGCQVAVRCPVRRILIENDKAVGVELESGEKIRAPTIISGAGAYTTLVDMLDPAISEKYQYREKLEKIGPSTAHCYFFLGYDEEIELTKQIIWEIPTYDIEDFNRKYKEEMDLENSFGGYLLCPSARDPVYRQRYPGKSTVIGINEIPHEWVERGNQDPQWAIEFSAKIANAFEKWIFRHLPQLKDKKPVVREAGFPYSCNPRAWKGASLGLASIPERFLDHTHWLRPQTDIPSLYLVGQDSFSMGFCGSMFSARLTYAALTKDYIWPMRVRI